MKMEKKGSGRPKARFLLLHGPHKACPPRSTVFICSKDSKVILGAHIRRGEIHFSSRPCKVCEVSHQKPPVDSLEQEGEKGQESKQGSPTAGGPQHSVCLSVLLTFQGL